MAHKRDVAALGARLRRLAAASRPEALRMLEELAVIDAPTGDAEALAPNADMIRRWLIELGGVVDVVPSTAGPHLRAVFGRGDGLPIAVLGHYDTVWPRGTADERPLQIRGEIASGPGLFDMRGGIVATLQAIRALTEMDELRRPVSVLLTADEESGSATSQELVESLASRNQTVLIPEPPLPGGALKTVRKGLLTYRIAVAGRAAHAGLEPEQGVSALHELVDLLARIRRLELAERGTTINVGTLTGGVAPNVVAAEATASVDIRVAEMSEYERIAAAVGELTASDRRSTLEIALLHGRPPMERTPAIGAAIERATGLAAAAGIRLEEGAAGGASDGNFLAPLGVAVIDGLGPEGGGAHSLDEHIVLRSLDERVILIALLLALL